MKHFIRPPQEDVVCAHCGFKFQGGGYVDHCPQCLWSKHVDDEVPGDRKSDCQGMMEPIKAEMGKRERIIIFYRCQKCGKEIKSSKKEEDNLEVVIDLLNKPYKDKSKNPL